LGLPQLICGTAIFLGVHLVNTADRSMRT
jgi:hypothetical protein